MRSLRVGLAQINCTVGDLKGNATKICHFIDKAKALGVDLLAFPELAITGYPPEDLLLKPQFVNDNLRQLELIQKHSSDITVVVGFIDAKDDLYNAAAIIHDGKLASKYYKTYLPNYGVFDENRYFQAGTYCPIFVINGVNIGINICEDIWYPTGPTSLQAYAGAEMVVNINASPYHAGKRKFRERMLATRASDNLIIICYVNLVGGQDELVFDGGSMVINERGELIASGQQFEEDLVVVDLDLESVFCSRLNDPRHRKEKLKLETEEKPRQRIVVSEGENLKPKPSLPLREVKAYELLAEVYQALVLGTGDYVRKNGFKKVIIGLSGGIDSSLVAVIAVDALGAQNVIGISMPSSYSSSGSKADAQLLAQNLGIELKVIPIEDTFNSYLNMLAPSFTGTKPDVTEENIQARIRGNVLMALSNKYGWLPLTTGNKSETVTGYCTLYVDMAGGFAVIKDVPKTLVYQLARYRNSLSGKEIIPRSVLEKEPSAELAPNQRDVDTLPPYEILDPILQAYVEENKSSTQIVAMGFNKETVQRVIHMVDKSEYKRRQAAPGIKITPRAFGKDRRLPITNRYREK